MTCVRVTFPRSLDDDILARMVAELESKGCFVEVECEHGEVVCTTCETKPTEEMTP